VTLAFAGPSKRMLAALEHLHLFGAGHTHRAFASRNEALEWCENEVLTDSATEERSGTAADFEDWLAAELGGRDKAVRIAPFFERRDLAAGSVLYRQGAAPDTIDLIVSGTVAVAVAGEPGQELLVRRMSKRTVVGEMGFFRGIPRAATVSAEQHASVYTLHRSSYDRLMQEEPQLGATFLAFIIRALSDRLEFANQGVAALS
jgi:SulP family sulfate permease